MRTTLKEALAAWRETQEAEPHPSLDDLYAVALHGVADAGAAVVGHVTRCAPCARTLRELMDEVEAAAVFDMAMAKAAAARLTTSTSMTTACGKYEIGIHPRADGSDEAFVTVEVTPSFRDTLEGSEVTVSDRTGRELLAGTIVLGRLAGRVREAAAIDCTRLTVRGTRPHDPE